MMARLIRSIEGISLSPVTWVMTLGAFALIRTVAEGVSQQLPYFLDAERWIFFLHAFLFYIAAFLGIALMLAVASGEKFEKTARFSLFLSLFILLPPVLDLIASHGHGALMTYRTIPPITGIFGAAASFWDFILWGPYGVIFWGNNARSIAQLGINYGIRIEILLEALVFTWYLFFKTHSAKRMLAGLGMLYGGIFLIGTLPSFAAWWSGMPVQLILYGKLSVLSDSFHGDNMAMAAVLLVIILVEALLSLWLWDRTKAKAFLWNARPLRVLLNLGIFTIGLSLGLRSLPSGATLTFFDWLLVVLGYVAVAAYWVWAVVLNDNADEAGDRISMPHRPLPQGTLTRSELGSLGAIALIISYTAALISGWGVFVMIMTRSALSRLYSLPPLRLKKIPILSNFVLGCAYLLTAAAGYLIVESNRLIDFPGRLACAILLAYTLIAEFKNIKDAEGDLADGVRTLPTMLGEKAARPVIGTLGLLGFGAFPLFYPAARAALLPAALLAGCAYYYVVTRRPYREGLVFGVIFIFIILLDIAWHYNIFIP